MMTGNYNRKGVLFGVTVAGIFIFLLCCVSAFAQNSKTADLTNQIINCKSGEEAYGFLKEATAAYFKDNKYNEYVEYLKSLSEKNKFIEPVIHYYIALTRYYQLKHLEESQNWNEYFGSGNAYRAQIIESGQSAVDKTGGKDPVHVSSLLILWRLHKDQEDNLADGVLSSLMNAAVEYAKDAAYISLLKDVADQFKSYGEKGKAKELYRLYVDKIIASTTKDENLGSTAGDFYKEGNLELSELLYDAYLDMSAASFPKEKFTTTAAAIARQFSYQSAGAKDLVYSEKVLKKLEDVGGKDVFDEGLLYLRAFDLEKMKEYSQAKAVYEDLIHRYPQSLHIDGINYKLGLITTYVLRDIKNGRGYFERLESSSPLIARFQEVAGVTQKETANPYVVLGLYQLGLLNQWEGDSNKAAGYYNKVVERAGDESAETANLAKERLKEINESKPIEFNLKTFLDVSLKEEYTGFDMTKIELITSPHNIKKGEKLNVSSSATIGETGCMQVKLDYLWSGDLGSGKPSIEESEFETVYPAKGVKQINLVVMSTTGILDRAVSLVDVYDSP